MVAKNSLFWRLLYVLPLWARVTLASTVFWLFYILVAIPWDTARGARDGLRNGCSDCLEQWRDLLRAPRS